MRKRTISLILLIIGLPMALVTAFSGGGVFAMFFAAILALGLDLFTESRKEDSHKTAE